MNFVDRLYATQKTIHELHEGTQFDVEAWRLERKTGSIHCFSPRSYPAKLPEVQYESGITVRHVRHKGEIKWRGELIYVPEVLAKEPVGRKPTGR